MKTVLVFVWILICGFAKAQIIDDPVSWEMELKPTTSANEIDIYLSAEVLKGWQLYSNDFDPNLGPMVTEFQYTVNNTFELVSGTIPQNSKRKYDDLWGGEYSYFEKEGLFIQRIKALSETPRVEVTINYQVCNTEDGKCIPFEVVLKNQERE